MIEVSKNVIGKRDKADFPLWGLKNIDVKIDTGAYTSSIHCSQIEVVKVNGKKRLKFELLDPTHKKYNGKPLVADKFSIKAIKSSNGEIQHRYIVQTEILLFDKIYPIQLSLSERGEMKFPVLLGRKLLTGNFVVDTAFTNTSFRRKKENAARRGG
jgi:hypothetical protein